MRLNNIAFFEGVISSFLLQPSNVTLRTRNNAKRSIKTGSITQDWQAVGSDFQRATDKVVAQLDIPQQTRLNSLRYSYGK